MRNRPWVVNVADGPSLEKCLNDLEENGHSIEHIFQVGAAMKQNRLDPSQQTLIPFMLVVAKELPDA